MDRASKPAANHTSAGPVSVMVACPVQDARFHTTPLEKLHVLKSAEMVALG